MLQNTNKHYKPVQPNTPNELHSTHSEADLLQNGEFRYLIGRAFCKVTKKCERTIWSNAQHQNQNRHAQYITLKLLKEMQIQNDDNSQYARSTNIVLQKQKYGSLTNISDDILEFLPN